MSHDSEVELKVPVLGQNDRLMGNGFSEAERGDGEAVQRGEGEQDRFLAEILSLPPVQPWPEPVNGSELLDEICHKIAAHVVLPKWAPETLALWVPHTYGFQHRDITTYIGIESPEHRCGKSTLVTVLSKMTHRSVVSSNVSTSSLFRVVAQVQPTLFIDEADTFLGGNEEVKGILNSSYYKETGFVLRAFNLPLQPGAEAGGPGAVNYNPGILRFSCWCPKLIARIGSLPVTLADRCIVFRLHRKTVQEQCERLKHFRAGDVQRKCLRFVLDHAAEIASAEPAIPGELNDRAADVWEPLLVIADLAGGPWPERARNAALALAAGSGDSHPMSVLLFDAYMQFQIAKAQRMFSWELVQRLNEYGERPWKELQRGKPIDVRWLARHLSPYGLHPRTMRLNGEQGKGYSLEDFVDIIQRYVPKSEARSLIDELVVAPEEGAGPAKESKAGEGAG